MTKAFKNYFVSIVVCCLDNEATHTQAIIARAAKAAGVILFVPSETFLPLSRPLRAGAEAYPREHHRQLEMPMKTHFLSPEYLSAIGVSTLRIVVSSHVSPFSTRLIISYEIVRDIHRTDSLACLIAICAWKDGPRGVRQRQGVIHVDDRCCRY